MFSSILFRKRNIIKILSFVSSIFFSCRDVHVFIVTSLYVFVATWILNGHDLWKLPHWRVTIWLMIHGIFMQIMFITGFKISSLWLHLGLKKLWKNIFSYVWFSLISWESKLHSWHIPVSNVSKLISSIFILPWYNEAK